jgi:hypothetical protein
MPAKASLNIEVPATSSVHGVATDTLDLEHDQAAVPEIVKYACSLICAIIRNAMCSTHSHYHC